MAEKRLLIAALFCTAAVRAGLWLLPFQTIRRIVGRAATGDRRPRAGEFTVQRLVRAVATASRCVPCASCLTQAMAAQVLLSRHGYASCLRIGVAKEASGPFEAHAWLERDGEVILGGTDTGRYTPLLGRENKPV